MNDAKYVPIDDVAAHFSVSISTVRSWIRKKQIPTETYIKVGNTYRFCIEDVTSALREEVLDALADEELKAIELPTEEGPYAVGEEGVNISYAADRREEALRAPRDVVNNLDEDQ